MKKHIYRLAPCPSWDIGATECWLEAMAAKGWRLERGGMLLGFASFERDVPAALRYRLDPAPEKASMWDKYDGEPSEESLELCEELGWEYVDRRGQFYIYRCADPEAPELNTEPETQAVAVDRFRRRELSQLISSALLLILYAFLFAYREPWLISILELGSGTALLGLVLLLWQLVRKAVMLRRVGRLKRTLAAGDVPPKKPPTTRSAALYHGLRLAFAALALLFAGLLLAGWVKGDDGSIPTGDYSAPLPFATFADLAEGEYIREDFMDFDKVSLGSDPLAPEIIHYVEHGTIKTARGSVSGGLYVDYYRMRFPALAESQARALLRRSKDTEKIAGAEGFDCAALTNDLRAPFTTAVFCRGDVLVTVMFYQHGDCQLSEEEWTSAVISALK